jgi:hypothetical protein
LELSAASLVSGVHVDLDGSTYSKTLERRAVFTLNDDEDHYFADRGRVSDKLFTVARHMAQFSLDQDEAWDIKGEQLDHGKKSVAGRNSTAGNAPWITIAEAKAGWKWAKMTDPMNRFNTKQEEFYDNAPFSVQIDGDYGFHRPKNRTTCTTTVRRGVDGTYDHFDATFAETGDEPKRRLLKFGPIAVDERHKVVDNFDFDLNVLLEFNNESVLLSQERGKPVHFSNLMLPQGRAALPSQDDAYRTS